MPGARWFPDARLNYAENLLRPEHDGAGDGGALVFRGEDGPTRRIGRAELRREAARAARALRAAGVGPGDRVAGYLPNAPEAVIAMLAASSIGAVWASCSPDFGARGALDPLRPDRAEGPHRLRRLPLRRQIPRRARAAARDRRRPARKPEARRRAVRRVRRPARRRGRMGGLARAARLRRLRVRTSALRPSPRDPVLLRDHGRAEMHRPRRRRNAAQAPERAPPARRRRPRRPHVLLHHHGLDDVELARHRAGERRRAAALRRLAAPPVPPASCSTTPTPRA